MAASPAFVPSAFWTTEMARATKTCSLPRDPITVVSPSRIKRSVLRLSEVEVVVPPIVALRRIVTSQPERFSWRDSGSQPRICVLSRTSPGCLEVMPLIELCGGQQFEARTAAGQAPDDIAPGLLVRLAWGQGAQRQNRHAIGVADANERAARVDELDRGHGVEALEAKRFARLQVAGHLIESVYLVVQFPPPGPALPRTSRRT